MVMGVAAGEDARVVAAPNAAQRQRLLLHRARRLLDVLGGIAGVAAERSLTRCPYRTRGDAARFAARAGTGLAGRTQARGTARAAHSIRGLPARDGAA
jgi:hypothetical protein